MIPVTVHDRPNLERLIDFIQYKGTQLVELRLDALPLKNYRCLTDLIKVLNQAEKLGLMRHVLLSCRGDDPSVLTTYLTLKSRFNHSRTQSPFALVDLPHFLYRPEHDELRSWLTAQAARSIATYHATAIPNHSEANLLMQRIITMCHANLYKLAMDTTPYPAVRPIHWIEQQNLLYQSLTDNLQSRVLLLYTGPAGFPSRFTTHLYNPPLAFYAESTETMFRTRYAIALPTREYHLALKTTRYSYNEQAAPHQLPKIALISEEALPYPSPETVANAQKKDVLALPALI